MRKWWIESFIVSNQWHEVDFSIYSRLINPKNYPYTGAPCASSFFTTCWFDTFVMAAVGSRSRSAAQITIGENTSEHLNVHINDVKKILFDTSECYQLSSGTNQPNKIFGRREIQEHLSIISEIEPSAASHAMSKPNLATRCFGSKRACIVSQPRGHRMRVGHITPRLWDS